MKIKRYGRKSDTGPALQVETPGKELYPAKHSNLGATLLTVQRAAEHYHSEGTFRITEEDGTLRATVTRTKERHVHTRVVGIHAHVEPTPA